MQGNWTAPLRRSWSCAVVTACLLSFGGEAAHGAAVGGTISSSGPLTRVQTTADLNCAVNHASDAAGEFFGDTACGTFAAVDGTLYGPATVPAGSNASPRTAWTPSAQTSSGAGTATNPYRIETTVTGGGLRIDQTDTYVTGVESYGTRVAVTNTAGTDRTVTLYRAGDCYLQDNDDGYGAVDPASGAVSCIAGLAPGSRIEQWAPITPGSRFYESYYGSIWAWIATQDPFPDSCSCDLYQDNGAGLSWTLTIPAGSTRTFSHLTAFSPTGTTEVADSDGDAFPDAWETPDGGVDTDGNGTPDLKLSDYGATPDRPDVFVQVGWTRTRTCVLRFFCSTSNRRPILEALRQVQRAFAARGVRLHIDAGAESTMNPDDGRTWGALAAGRHDVEAPSHLAGLDGDELDWSAFDGLRGQLLPGVRERLFHFALYIGRFDADGHSGLARQSNEGALSGRDFILSHDVPYAVGDGHGGPSLVEEAGTFMHELGHNLGLTHGGSLADARVIYKPNYPSVMNYAWQLSGVAKDSNMHKLDYSTGTLDPIDERALSERDALAPDAIALDVATKWSCPDRSYRGPSPSIREVDWDCSGGPLAGGTVAANVNNPAKAGNDDSRTVLHDHDDWSSLVFDGGGALGGAGDAAAAAARTPIDEAPSSELVAAAGDVRTVVLGGPGQMTMRSGTSSPLSLTIENRREQPRTYRLSTTSAGVTLTGLPAEVALAPGETRTLPAVISAGGVTDSAFFELNAGSDDIADSNALVAEVFVVDQAVPDQPLLTGPPASRPGPGASAVPPAAGATGAIATIADIRTPLRVRVDRRRAEALRPRAVGRAVVLPVGRHTVTVTGGSRKKRRTTVARVHVRSRALAAIVVTMRRGRPRVRTVVVAPGSRKLLSLLPGSRTLRLGAGRRGSRLRARRGAVIRLRPAVGVLRLRGSAKLLRLPPRAQLLVLKRNAGRITLVARGAG